MKNFAKIDMKDILPALLRILKNITKKQIIIFLILSVVLYAGYFYANKFLEKRGIEKKAQELVTRISQEQRDFFAKHNEYNQDFFENKNWSFPEDKNSLSGDDFSEGFRKNAREIGSKKKQFDDYSSSQIGDFYVEIDAENACMVLKYKRNTSHRTNFYASFEEGKVFCSGKKCLREKKDLEGKVCYKSGTCFLPSMTQETTKVCGNGHGKQTRTCTPSCDSGFCSEWGECVCEEGYAWNGITCAQIQTAKDCTEDQCFNGILCQDKEILEKEIENGTCIRKAACEKNKGWQYSDWECSCSEEDLCSLKEICVKKPKAQKSLVLDDKAGNCQDIYYTCKEGHGWQMQAKKCTCDKVGSFWDSKQEKAFCSDCTNKPENSHFIGIGKDKDDCPWKCDEGYSERKGQCLKPNGQFLCVQMSNQICTDDFSKERKLKKDTKPNEGQLCFIEDNENILFHAVKAQSCVLCQCVDLTLKDKP